MGASDRVSASRLENSQLPDPSLFLAFVAAVAVLMLIPGPNVALIVSNSVAYGPRYGLLTVVGTASAMVVQLALTTLGMTQALGALGAWFEALRWVGVAYLVMLGITQWRAAPIDLADVTPEPRSPGAIYWRALFVSLTNPKTLLFYGAFFPQFIDLKRDAGPQLAILCGAFLAIALVIDSAWAIIAGRARWMLASRGRLRNRIAGGVLVGAGAALALTRTK
jgi:homoserine/homoserine lactone efflux protein